METEIKEEKQLVLKRVNIFEKINKSFLKFFSGTIIVRARKNYSAAILEEKKIEFKNC